MALAAENGHENIVRLCHDEWGADNIDQAMTRAAEGGHKAIVRLCSGWAFKAINIEIEQWLKLRVATKPRKFCNNKWDIIVK
jgi:hypothetical protein